MLTRETPGYEEARRRGWQIAVPERFPELIIYARSPGEVADAVHLARVRNLPLAIRGSGHNYTSTFLRDGGLLLDVSALRQVRVDAGGQRAWAQPGIINRELAEVLDAHGAAFPAGHNGKVGLGGYLLGGGMGWNGETWGQFACFSVEAVDVITAEGRAITVSEDSHPELFWAARGAGPLFPAVATGFHLRTYPRPTILTSRYVYPLAAAGELARWLQPIAAQGNPGLEMFVTLRCEEAGATGGPRQICVVYALSFGSDRETAEQTLQHLQAGRPGGALDCAQGVPATFADLYAQDRTGPARRIAADTAWGEDALALTEASARFLARAPSPYSVIIINYRAPPRLPADAACSMAGSTFVQWVGQWDDAAGDQANLAWVDELARELDPCSQGAYVNESDILRRPGRLQHCFSPAALARLRAVRTQYDAGGWLPPPVPV